MREAKTQQEKFEMETLRFQSLRLENRLKRPEVSEKTVRSTMFALKRAESLERFSYLVNTFDTSGKQSEQKQIGLVTRDLFENEEGDQDCCDIPVDELNEDVVIQQVFLENYNPVKPQKPGNL